MSPRPSIFQTYKAPIAVLLALALALGEQPEYTRINGADAVLIAILRQPGANVVLVSAGVKAKVAALQSGLPRGVKLAPYYDQADFVAEVVRSVENSLWIGLALALAVTALFLRSWRATLTILGAIPVALALTLAVLYFGLGYSFNIMTLGAIAAAIGLMIDDAVVMVEQLHRVGEDHPDAPPGEVGGAALGGPPAARADWVEPEHDCDFPAVCAAGRGGGGVL